MVQIKIDLAVSELLEKDMGAGNCESGLALVHQGQAGQDLVPLAGKPPQHHEGILHDPTGLPINDPSSRTTVSALTSNWEKNFFL